MDEEMKKELLMATWKDPRVPPTKGVDGKKFVGAMTWLADQEEAEIATYALLTTKLTGKFGGDRVDDVSPQLVQSQLKMLTQEEKTVKQYIIAFKEVRDKVTAAQLGEWMTPGNVVETFVSGLNPGMVKKYIKEEKSWRTLSWDDTKKKVREVEIQYKLGEDPILVDNRRKWSKTTLLEDTELVAKRHRQQASKHKQEKANLQRQLDEVKDREKQLVDAQRKYVSTDKLGSGNSNGNGTDKGKIRAPMKTENGGMNGNGGRLSNTLSWNCWSYGHHGGICMDAQRTDEEREQLRIRKNIPAPRAW